MNINLEISEKEYELIEEYAKKFNMDIKTYIKLTSLNNGISYNLNEIKDKFKPIKELPNTLIWNEISDNMLYASSNEFIFWLEKYPVQLHIVFDFGTSTVLSKRFDDIKSAKDYAEIYVRENNRFVYFR